MTWAYAGEYASDVLYRTQGAAGNAAVTVTTSAGEPAALYTDATKETPLGSNVVTTDQYGNLTFFADPGTYTCSAGGAAFTAVVAVNPLESGGGGSGSVTSVAVESANGLTGTVADDTTTPQITLETTVTGLLKGDGTAISAAEAGTDYLAPDGDGSGLTGITASQTGALPAAGGTLTGDVTQDGTGQYTADAADGPQMRLGQKANGEAVWSWNVNQNDGDAIDDASLPAWKFSIEGGPDYNGAEFQSSPSGGTWDGTAVFSLDEDGNVAIAGQLTPDGGISSAGQADGLATLDGTGNVPSDQLGNAPSPAGAIGTLTTSNAGEQTLTVTENDYTVMTWEQAQSAQGVTLSPDDGTVTALTAGAYAFRLDLTIKRTGTGLEFACGFFVNGTEVTEVIGGYGLTITSTQYHFSGGFAAVLDAGDVVTVRVTLTDASGTLVVTDAQLTVTAGFSGETTIVLDDDASDIQAIGTSAGAGSTGKAADAGHVHPGLDSPALTGSPTAPTQTSSDNSTKIATDAFVQTVAAAAQAAAEAASDPAGSAATAQSAAETYAAGLQPTSGSPLALVKGGTGVSAASDAALLADLGAAPLASPAFTGTPAAPTASALTDSTQLATTAYADSAVAVEKSRAGAAEALLAPLASPALTGSPTAPTKSALTNSADIATTAYADLAVGVETSRAEGAESTNASAISAETSRAEAAEALKAPLASPALTGVPTAPTASALTDSVQLATTAYADSAVAAETSRAETAEAGKLAAANDLSELTSTAATARVNLGLGSAATQASSAFLQPANNLSDVSAATTALANLGGVPLASEAPWTPADMGLLALSFPVECVSTASAQTSGTIYVTRINVRQQMTCTNVVIFLEAQGSSLTASENYCGLYAGQTSGGYTAMNQIGLTADQHTNWASSSNVGAYPMALAGGPYTLPAGFCYVAFLCNGTGTNPSLFRSTAPSNGSAAFNAGTTSASYRTATAGTAQTSLPGTLGGFSVATSILLMGLS